MQTDETVSHRTIFYDIQATNDKVIIQLQLIHLISLRPKFNLTHKLPLTTVFNVSLCKITGYFYITNLHFFFEIIMNNIYK